MKAVPVATIAWGDALSTIGILASNDYARAIPQNMQTLVSEKLQRNRTILTTCQSDTL